ncbi:DUF512 domain-containing protein [Clostridium sp. DL1XJH146]
MFNVIDVVIKGSIAEEAGMEKGDKLLSINDTEIKDIIDYKYLITDEYMTLQLEKQDGEVWDIEIEKEYDEDLGIEFCDPILDNPRSCHNNCIFCFIDQLPAGMRETLYFKDDDSRLSFFQGNFVTLTNMKEEDIDRIIRYRISPINVSVHTTNPELRIKMMHNRFAGNVFDRLSKLAKAGIEINCQIVLCPGYNDREELNRTIMDLYPLYPSISKIVVVPIGITKFREKNNLVQLKLFDEILAQETIDQIEKFQRKFVKDTGEAFVFLGDEFYIIANKDVPKSDFYGDFGQLEDGVGVIRKFRDNLMQNISYLDKTQKGSYIFITGAAAYEEINSAANTIMKTNNMINIKIVKIINKFFGETITVSGLITGKDIVEGLSNIDTKAFSHIILPDNIIRKGYEISDNKDKVLLDDFTIEELEKKIAKKIILCDYLGGDLIDKINFYSEEE